MNITISTTQWGDARESAVGSVASHKQETVGRNLMLAVTTVTLAGLLAIQALSPRTVDSRIVVNDVEARTVDAIHGEDFMHLKRMRIEELLQNEVPGGRDSSDELIDAFLYKESATH